MKIIIGSTAARYHLKESFWRNPNDLDLLETNKPPNQYSGNIDDWNEFVCTVVSNSQNKKHADLNLLYTLKVSHAKYDVHWEKTMLDIMRFKDLKIDQIDEEVFYSASLIWKNLHKRTRVNLDVQNSDFFSDQVQRKYEHDWLHEQVSFYERPLNEQIRIDLKSAKCYDSLFQKLCYNNKILLCLEEIIVVAIERSRLTNTSTNLDIKKAIYKSYKQLVTTMTDGVFNHFLIENRKQILILGENLWKTQMDKTLLQLQTIRKSDK